MMDVSAAQEMPQKQWLLSTRAALLFAVFVY